MADAGARVLELEAQKRAAVDREDYDAAKRLKQELDELHRLINACMQEARKRQVRRDGVPQDDLASAQKRIEVLEAEKAEAVKSENYAAAQALKTEIEKLRAQIAAQEPLPPAAGYLQVNSLDGGPGRAANIEASMNPARLFAS